MQFAPGQKPCRARRQRLRRGVRDWRTHGLVTRRARTKCWNGWQHVTVDYDLLLAFLSEKGRGTWGEFKEAYDWLVGPTDDPSARAWIAARDLAALGHIEVAWGETIHWCAADPILTMLPRSGGRAFLTGARTRHLYRPGRRVRETGQNARGVERREAATGRLVEECERLGLWPDEIPASSGPVTVLIASAGHDDVERLARELGITCTYSVAEQIAALLPPLEAYMAQFEAGDLPRGFEAERFDAQAIGWLPTSSFDERGLYRCRTYAGHVHALLDATWRWRRVEREFGIYEVLRWEERPVLSYSEASFELRVPAEAGLPALHARAATLCSGRLPRRARDSGTGSLSLTFANVPWDLAERIASSLGQRLSEE